MVIHHLSPSVMIIVNRSTYYLFCINVRNPLELKKWMYFRKNPHIGNKLVTNSVQSKVDLINTRQIKFTYSNQSRCAR